MPKSKGSWDQLEDWPLIGLHAIVTQDGKVLTFGTDSRGMQGGQFIYDVYDPVTGTHTTLSNTTPTDIFCSAALVIPGTDQILIGGGDARPHGNTNAGVDDVNIFDSGDLSLSPYELGTMNFQRWYPTMVSLASGQIVILGGTDQQRKGIATPEIFTPGEGWRTLDGATDTDLASSSYYPRTFVSNSGDIVYFASGKGSSGAFEVRSLDPSGNGSLKTIATLPFTTAWDSAAVMYEAGKVLIQATNGDLWTMDITGNTPIFEKSATLSQDRNWANMTVLADGSVMINGGTSQGNKEAGADKTAAIWNPDTGQISYGADEDQPRLYHSASVLLADGTLLSLGGGSAGSAENNYLDSQIYRPPYLYNDDGTLADRPVVSGAPASVNPGETFTLNVTDANDISKFTFVKTGAATHAVNMDTRMVDLEFSVIDANTVEVTVPENVNEVTAGSWMLFAWNGAGVPSIAPLIAVEPTLSLFDGTGDLIARYLTIDSSVTTLNDINFDADEVHQAQLLEVNIDTSSSLYAGGASDHVALQISGSFMVVSDGDYTFHLKSDDGSALFVDGQRVVDNDGLHSPTEKNVTVSLQAGIHDIEIRYFEQTGRATLDLDWSGPGFEREQMRFDGAQNNLLINGSFEKADVAVNGHVVGKPMAGWTVEGTSQVFGSGYAGTQPTSGNTFVEVDGRTGSISQSFQSTKGQTYQLAFDMAGRPGTVQSSTLEVSYNGVVLQTIVPTDENWHRYTVDFVGTGGNDDIAFRSTDNADDNVGVFLDAVVLSPIEADSEKILDIPHQTQFVDGHPENHEAFVINGDATDYGWGPTDDGKGIVVWGPTGFDILTNIDALQFNDLTVPLKHDDGIYYDLPNVTQYLAGTTDKDVFVVNGESEDYNWSTTEDEAGIVLWNDDGFDILTDFELLRFADKEVDITKSSGPLTVQDDPNRTEHLNGTDGKDVFVINGNATDYGWDVTEDGTGTVVWNAANHDVLYDFEELQFIDQTIDI